MPLPDFRKLRSRNASHRIFRDRRGAPGEAQPAAYLAYARQAEPVATLHGAKKTCEALRDFIFPDTIYCAACGGYLSGGTGYALCEACAEETALPDGPLCAKCGKPLDPLNTEELCGDCSVIGHVFSRCYAATGYSGAAMELVQGLKFRDRPYHAEVMALLMAERLRSLTDPETGEVPCFDILVNVPVSAKKLKTRGYDQAALIAGRLSRETGMPHAAGLLRRARDTTAQSTLNRDERRLNLREAFAPGERQAEQIKGKSILLIDDVYTTGATVDACAEVLLEAGACEVGVLVFAIGADFSHLSFLR